jgi:hypothetical protein
VAAIHLPHPARADEFANFIDAETTTERKRHPEVPLIIRASFLSIADAS